MLEITGACLRVLAIALMACGAVVGVVWLITGLSAWFALAVGVALLVLASVLRGIQREWSLAARWRWWWFR